MSTKLKPLGAKILIEPIKATEKIGRILIPESAQEKPLEGIVITLGTGKRDKDGMNLPFKVKEGDRVLFGKYAGTEIKIDGQDYNLIHADDILAILE